MTRCSQDSPHLCNRGKQILDLCTSSKLRIVNGQKTGDALGRYTCHKNAGSSLVDYVIVSERVFKDVLHLHVNSFKGHLSDHCSISWAIQCNVSDVRPKPKCKYVNFPEQYRWDKESIFRFQQALCNEDIKGKISDLLSSDDNRVVSANKRKDIVTDILMKAADVSLKKKILSKRKQNANHKKWYDKTLQEMKKEVILNSKLLQRYPNIPDVRHNFFTSLKRYNKSRKRKARQYKEKILHQLDDLKDKNPGAYWKLLKELKTKDSDDKSSQISLDEWELYFKSLNVDRHPQKNFETKQKLCDLEREQIFNETDFKITTHEISRCVKKLKNNKSPGLDRILPEMLKYSQHVLLPILEKLFNTILQDGKYPSNWLSGYIVPIYKKGDATDP